MRKKLLLCLWLLIIIVFPIVVFVYEKRTLDNNVPYISSSAVIENLDVNIDVNKDNSIDVTEMIIFNLVEGTPFKGIKVNLPLRDTISGYKRNLKLSNITSEDVSIDINKRFNYVEAHLGKNNGDMESGLYTYTINYHYDLGSVDDSFIYRVFSNAYNLDIINMNLVVNFKENIDKNKIKFISKDSDVTNRVTFGVEDNVLRASINDFILDNDLIIDIGVGNYFDNVKSNNGIVSIIMLIIIGLLTIGLAIFNIVKHSKLKDIKTTYDIDIKCILGHIVLLFMTSFIYLFIHDLVSSLEFIYYIVYGIISLSGLLIIDRLKVK